MTPGGAERSLDPSGVATFMGVYIEGAGIPEGFVFIPPGSFSMGSPADEPGRHANREQQNLVILTQGVAMSQREVTEAWWAEVMNMGASESQLPQQNVSWDDAVAFCNALSLREGLTPAYAIAGPDGELTWDREVEGYRLPT